MLFCINKCYTCQSKENLVKIVIFNDFRSKGCIVEQERENNITGRYIGDSTLINKHIYVTVKIQFDQILHRCFCASQIIAMIYYVLLLF